MAKVSLDGLRIEVAHSSPPAEVAQKLEEFAQDMATNKFSDWGVTINREGGRLQLTGRRAKTHFDADVESSDGLAVVTLTGSIDLSMIKLGLAGGSEGVRRRVTDSLSSTLREHLA